jgi:hypothetical protein
MTTRIAFFLFTMSVAAAAQTLAGAQADSTFRYRWNGYGYFAAGGGMADDGSGKFRGGGAGAEGFFWKRFTAGADVSVFQETYLRASRTFGHAGVNAGYHFASRAKTRGMDPFVLFGVGGFFPDEPKAVVHGGGGFTYWFSQRLGVRLELRVGERMRGDDIVSIVRLGLAFR